MRNVAHSQAYNLSNCMVCIQSVSMSQNQHKYSFRNCKYEPIGSRTQIVCQTFQSVDSR